MNSETILDYLQERPVKEIERHVREVRKLFAAKSEEHAQAAADKEIEKISRKLQRKVDKIRTKEIMKRIITESITLPRGMNGFHKELRMFVRWLPGYSQPVSEGVTEEHSIMQGWHVDNDIGIRIKWNSDGFFTMRRKDSAAFNNMLNPDLWTEDEDHPHKRKQILLQVGDCTGQKLSRYSSNANRERREAKRFRHENRKSNEMTNKLNDIKSPIINETAACVQPERDYQEAQEEPLTQQHSGDNGGGGDNTEADTEAETDCSPVLDRTCFVDRVMWSPAMVVVIASSL